MCYGCWEEAGSPKIVNEKVLAAVPLVQRVYDFSCVGGNMHIHLDDWNLDDEFFEAFEVHHAGASPEQIAAERACFEAFKAMSEAERYSALALEADFFSVNG